MHHEYTELIAGLDRVLSQIRKLWMEESKPAEKTKWRVRLDELLDERLRLMAKRDAARSTVA